jgi:5'-3' exoribonuclease 1
MGVPGFYRWLINQKWAKMISNNLPGNHYSLLIDLPGILHNVAQKVWCYGEHKNIDILNKISSDSDEELIQRYLTALSAHILEVIHNVSPQEYVFIAFDGVAPQAKISQQRFRRFKASRDKDPDVFFDSNSLTPGTYLMNRVNEHLKNWIEQNKLNIAPKIIFSSHLVPGEGEHKIMDYLRNNKIPSLNNYSEGVHVIYGMDADLYFLSMLSPQKQLVLWTGRNINGVVFIDLLKEYITKYLGDSETATDDFVIMMSLLGNDFIPSQVCFGSFDVAISMMVDIYNKHELFFVDEKSNIIWNNIYFFIEQLSFEEPDLLDFESKRDFVYRSKMFDESTTMIRQSTMEFKPKVKLGSRRKVQRDDRKKQSGITNKFIFNQDSFKNKWRENSLFPKNTTFLNTLAQKLDLSIIEDTFQLSNESKHKKWNFSIGDPSIQSMVISYLNGIAWTYTYYKKGLYEINIDWYYNYFHSPLFQDIRDISQLDLNITDFLPKNHQQPLKPYHQLLCVMPPSSIQQLPEEIQYLITDESIIYHYYPTQFDIELEGKMFEYKGIPIIPFIDLYKIRSIMNLVFEENKNIKRKFDKIFPISNDIIFELTEQEKNLLPEKLPTGLCKTSSIGYGTSILRQNITPRGTSISTGRGRTRGGTRSGNRGRGRDIDRDRDIDRGRDIDRDRESEREIIAKPYMKFRSTKEYSPPVSQRKYVGSARSRSPEITKRKLVIEERIIPKRGGTEEPTQMKKIELPTIKRVTKDIVGNKEKKVYPVKNKWSNEKRLIQNKEKEN